jgi:hypothetical protein
MGALLVGSIVFVCLFGAVLVGMALARRLPGHHLDGGSRDVIKLATAVVGTLAALALGLLVASAKTTYENANAELRTSVARVVLLDRVMARYGPETNVARARLRTLVEARLRHAWDGDASAANAGGEEASIEPVQEELRALSGDTNAQRLLQARALQVSGDIAEAHWLLTETVGSGLPWAFLAVLVFWLGLLFVTFGLMAPANATVVGLLFACALSVAAAVFLIVDMDHPYRGIIHVSDAPLRTALERLGQK